MEPMKAKRGRPRKKPYVATSEPEKPYKRGFAKDDRPETPEEKLRLCMWFISKFSSPDDAVKSLTAAVTAVKTLEEM